MIISWDLRQALGNLNIWDILYFFFIYYGGSTILAVSFENSKAIRIDFDVVYQNGCPPFHHACWNGILWTYQIRIWIDFYGVDCDGNTPLHFASMEGQRDIVKLLLDLQ